MSNLDNARSVLNIWQTNNIPVDPQKLANACGITLEQANELISKPTNGHSTPAEVAAASATPAAIRQPDSHGEFVTPLDGALWMAFLGVPQIPLRPRTKIAIENEWQKSASTDPEQIRKWSVQYPGCNFGSVASNGIFIFEADSTDVRNRFKATGKEFTAKLIIESSPGKGHRYYRLAEGVEGIGQSGTTHGDFSVRVGNAYGVTAGSIHPDTGKQYRVAVSGIPDVPSADEIAFWNSEKKADNHNVADDFSLIPQGQRNSTITSILGKARQATGADYDALLALARQHNDRCTPALPDDDLKTIADSISKYPVRTAEIEFQERINARALQARQATENQPEQVEALDIDKSESVAYPVFPEWVMSGTSLYDGFVKPTYDTSDKYAQLLFMPAILMFVNYISAGRVRIKHCPLHLNMYVGIIGPYGKFYKSSSVEDAMQYFNLMGLCNKTGAKSADKIVITNPGSTEGLCLKLSKLQATHSVIFNDELSKFVAKANIENSTFVDAMCSFYDSRQYQNDLKRVGESFEFQAGTYCFSWLWCTTDRKFPGLWMKLPGDHVDLDNRMIFLLTPEKPRVTEHRFTQANVGPGSVETKNRIDKAVLQCEWDYTEDAPIDEYLAKFSSDPRDQALLQTLALYFAIDLNRNLNPEGKIGPEAVERAAALVEYRQQTLRFLDISDTAETPQGRLQKRMIREIRRHGGEMRYREFCRNLDTITVGTDIFNRAIQGLVQVGVIALKAAVPGKGAAQQPAMIYLLKNDFVSADED